MKKLKTNIFVLMVVSLFVSSCDVMDTEPFESYSEELVWSDKATADAFVYQTYANIVGGLYADPIFEDYLTTNITSYWNWGINVYAREQFDRFNGVGGFGNFGNVRRCNIIIEKSQASPSLSEGQKAELVAEGKMLRAMLYYHQARRMGRIVYIDKVLSPEDTDAFNTPFTASPSETYPLIIKDIDDAISGLPTDAIVGRFNKYAAYAFKSEVCLQAAAYTGQTEYYDQAITAANAVIDSGKYQLVGDFESIFRDGGHTSSEVILAIERVEENTTFWNIGGMMNMIPNISNDDLNASQSGPLLKDEGGRSFGGWHFHSPAQNLVDDFLVVDEADGLAKPWDQTTQYTSAVSDDTGNLSIGDYTTFPVNIPHEEDMESTTAGPIIVSAGKTSGENVSEIMYNNRDERFYATIVYDSTTWIKNELVTMNVNGNLWGFSRGGGNGGLDGWHTTTSNYYFKKTVYDHEAQGPVPTDYHYMVFRLGRVYLNKAEAHLQKGQISEAVDALNETRVIHGKLPVSTASTIEDAWEDYKRERRVELVLENDYYFSLLRWGKIGGPANHGLEPNSAIPELNESAKGIQISKDRTRYYIGQMRRLGDWERHFTPKRYLFPIPQGALDERAASGIIDQQNPGW
ncbi:RagB/SusD family nutrient uptake outer membrane protein [uncultured Wocania sp.]|uniref:RagB/SusD family nutrient uptake outer membrane protein n=1 Tax=uncultured Wocania sp. TaxID=2834404 RepID=UPI0030FA4486